MSVRKFTRNESGSTLVELLVVLVIVSILAVTAIPFAETAFQRKKELELRETLRMTRQAIDAFHADWQADMMVNADLVASDFGYPRNLDALISGTLVETNEQEFERRYLRRLPQNPFADPASPMDIQWHLLGYEQRETGSAWNRDDVYDLRTVTDKEGLDGSNIADW